MKKLNVQPIQAIEEVNMFKADGNVIHFAAPKGKDSPQLVLDWFNAGLKETSNADQNFQQFMLQYPPIRSLYTAMERIRS